MQYRRLGRSGLQVSLLSLGSWVTYHNQVDVASAKEMLAAAMDAGVNFYDNAEGYALGKSETLMGQAMRELGWPRLNYVVSTKFYWGLSRDEVAINRKNTLNRFGPVREVTHEAHAGLVFEVAFEGLQRSTRHKSGLAMRFPRINRIRWDKPPREADHIEVLEAMLPTNG